MHFGSLLIRLRQLSLKHQADIERKSRDSKSSNGDLKSPAAAASPASRPQVQNYKPKKPKLDIKDFQFVNLKGEVKVKLPG